MKGTGMPDFIETIRVVDGSFRLLPLHAARMRATCREAYGCEAPALGLSPADIPADMCRGTVKCRVRYGREIGGVEFERYEPRRVRTLRAVRADGLDYHLKHADRAALDAVRGLRGDADEVVIVRGGLVADTSFSNPLFRTADRLLTPRRPLLKGVMRRWLLDRGIAEEADIPADMLVAGNPLGITEALMINAMLPLGAVAPIPVERILF